MVFSRLKVISEAETPKSGKTRWNCICACSNTKTVFGYALLSGSTTSCGCYAKEMCSITNTTHGQAIRETPEYMAWRNIIERCTNPNCESYPNYGGRGISICDRWRHSFENFFEDMGPKPSKKHTIDRENNEGNYDPCNCRWEIMLVQARNRRSNIWLEYKGERKTATDWSIELKVSLPSLRYQMKFKNDLEVIEYFKNQNHVIRQSRRNRMADIQ